MAIVNVATLSEKKSQKDLNNLLLENFMQKKSSQIKVKKKTFYMLSTALLFIAVVILAYFYLTPNQKSSSIEEIQEYKKALFEGTLCHYSCPLTEILFNNETILFPEPACSQGCTKALEEKFSRGQFSEAELLTDNLLLEIETAITFCRNTNELQENGLTMKNTQSFFECAIEGLEDLRKTYPYIN